MIINTIQNSTNLEVHAGVEQDDSSLVGLSDIAEDAVDHTDEHAVFVWMTSVLDDGDDVRSFLGNVQKIATRTMTELDGVDETLLEIEIC